MPSRRDVLRILLLSSGSLYMSAPLGSCHRDLRKAESFQTQKEHVAHQRYSIPHQYLRDHARDRLSWHRARLHTSDVTIVGAGPAAITAAIAITAAGYHVTIIENEPIGGGAARSGSYRKLSYPLAAIYFVDRSATIEELCRFAGVDPIAVPDDALVLNGQTYRSIWNDSTIQELPITDAERMHLRQFRDELLQRRDRGTIPSYPLPDILPAELAPLDAQSAAAYLARYRSPFLLSLLDMYTRSSMGGTVEEVNAYALLNFYATEIDAPRYTFPGGLGGLMQPILRKLGDRVRLEETCIRIDPDVLQPATWTIDREGTLHCYRSRVVIVAIQKFMLPWIISDLPPAQQAAMRSLSYAPFLTVHLCADNLSLPFAFDMWVPEGNNLFTDIIIPQPTGQATQTGSIASIYAPRTAKDRAIMQSDDILAAFARRIAERAVAALPSVTPEAISEIHVFGWGHALVVPAVGSHSGIAQMARQPIGNVLFANTDNDSSPAFENAVAHGQRAAEQAIALLKR